MSTVMHTWIRQSRGLGQTLPVGVAITDTPGNVFYESIKRELKTRPINECRCDERLKTKVEKSTRLTYSRLLGELEHLKIKTITNL
jgi:hypothetical protein